MKEKFLDMLCGDEAHRKRYAVNPHYVDITTGRLYDAIEFHAGATLNHHNNQFFMNVGPISGKTYADTNVDQSGQLCAPEAFLVDRVILSFSARSLDEDVFNIAENFAYEFWLGCKAYLRVAIISMRPYSQKAPIWVCEFCSSVFANQAGCPNCGAGHKRIHSYNGEEVFIGKQFAMDVETPLLIQNQMRFYSQLVGRPLTMAGNLKMWCTYEGLHARGVQ